MIPVPTKRIMMVLLIPLIITVLGFQWSIFFMAAVILDILILGFACLDIFHSISKKKIDFTIDKEKIFSIGRKNNYPLIIKNISTTKIKLETKLGLPEFFEDQTEVKLITVGPGEQHKHFFTIRPSRRGSFPVQFVYYRMFTNFKWFHIHGRKKVNVLIDVYPDIKEINKYLAMTRKNREYEMGIHRNRWQGMGTELESLRDYRKDDDSKNIDWKASTRLNKPVVKVFQQETNNNIVLVLDCGRLMTAEQEGLNTLDHAVNSVLMLSHIAFKREDILSVIAFSDRIIGELPPLKGKASLKKISSFVTRLKPEYVESNYKLVFNYLQKRLKKRSLIIFLTDMIDDINYKIFQQSVSRLNKKHLSLFVLLKDVILVKNAEKAASSLDDAFVSTAARDMYLRRSQAVAKLKHHKIDVLDVLPQQLTGQLIDKYLEIKSKSRL